MFEKRLTAWVNKINFFPDSAGINPSKISSSTVNFFFFDSGVKTLPADRFEPIGGRHPSTLVAALPEIRASTSEKARAELERVNLEATNKDTLSKIKDERFYLINKETNLPVDIFCESGIMLTNEVLCSSPEETSATALKILSFTGRAKHSLILLSLSSSAGNNSSNFETA